MPRESTMSSLSPTNLCCEQAASSQDELVDRAEEGFDLLRNEQESTDHDRADEDRDSRAGVALKGRRGQDDRDDDEEQRREFALQPRGGAGTDLGASSFSPTTTPTD